MAVLVTGCGVLGLNDAGPAQVTQATSAAPVATATAPESGEITVPTLQTGTSAPRSTPTPWQSMTTTAGPSTTSQAPLTAPTTTKTLTFTSMAPVTAPSTAKPTAIVSPPPDCYTKHTCPAQASAPVAGGIIEIVNQSDASHTVAVFTAAGGKPTAMPVARLSRPTVGCVGSYCLLQGDRSGLFFGSLILVKGGVLKSVSGTATSGTALKLVGGGAPVVAGTYRFDSYGVMLDDAPVAARTWGVAGGQLTATGCGEPYLYATPPLPAGPVRGPCSGTPRVAGYGPSSGNTFTSLSGFLTPSGNISCALLPGDRLVCTAKKSTISVPKCTDPDLKNTVGLTGLRVQVGRSTSVKKDNCIGYDLYGVPQTKISYRRLAVGHGFVCEVLQDGVTCTAPSGRGFTLSRSELSTF